MMGAYHYPANSLHVEQLGIFRQICLCLIYNILYLLFGDFGRNVCIKFTMIRLKSVCDMELTLLTFSPEIPLICFSIGRVTSFSMSLGELPT